MTERHHVLSFDSQVAGERKSYLYCTTEEKVVFRVPDGLTTKEVVHALMEAERAHNPRCEAVTTHERVPLSLSCERMDGHDGKHHHLVEWS